MYRNRYGAAAAFNETFDTIPDWLDIDLPENEPDNSLSVDEEIHRADFRNEILRLSDKLSKTQKEVFILRDIQNLPIQDVQKLTGLGIGSIKTNLYLARKRLRELLDPEWNKK